MKNEQKATRKMKKPLMVSQTFYWVGYEHRWADKAGGFQELFNANPEQKKEKL